MHLIPGAVVVLLQKKTTRIFKLPRPNVCKSIKIKIGKSNLPRFLIKLSLYITKMLQLTRELAGPQIIEAEGVSQIWIALGPTGLKG